MEPRIMGRKIQHDITRKLKVLNYAKETGNQMNFYVIVTTRVLYPLGINSSVF